MIYKTYFFSVVLGIMLVYCQLILNHALGGGMQSILVNFIIAVTVFTVGRWTLEDMWWNYLEGENE